MRPLLRWPTNLMLYLPKTPWGVPNARDTAVAMTSTETIAVAVVALVFIGLVLLAKYIINL